MPETNLPNTQNPSNKETKHHNLIWVIAIVVILGPALFLAWSIIIQPSGNQIYYSLQRPDEGTGFDIQKATVDDNGQMEITVSYLGGCGDHTFDLYVEGQKSDINRQVEIYHTTDDSCTTKVVEDLRYDIESVLEEHDSPQVVLTIRGNGAEVEPLLIKKPKSDSP